MSTIDRHLKAQLGGRKYDATLPIPDPVDPDRMMTVMVFGDFAGGQFSISKVVHRYNGEDVPEETWRPLEQNLLDQLPEEVGDAPA